MSAADDTTVIARMVTRIVVPIILLTAVALLLQGHNLPGGGFIAGVLTVTAVALVYVVYGLDYLEREVLDRGVRDPAASTLRPPVVGEYWTLFALGLLVAAGSGAAVAVLFGDPFLSMYDAVVHGLPVYGELHLASALAFDVGVYLVVVGALLTILAVVGAE